MDIKDADLAVRTEEPRSDRSPWLIALVVFAAYSVISVSYYVRLYPGSLDLAIFTQYVKQPAPGEHVPVACPPSPGQPVQADLLRRSGVRVRAYVSSSLVA